MTEAARRPSLRAALLVNLGAVAAGAALLAGTGTALLTGADVRAALGPLAALWLGSALALAGLGAYALERLVVAPARMLAEEADAIAAGEPAPPARRYGSAELDHLAGRYRALAADLLDLQSHAVRMEKLAGIGRLAAGVAHEVRNPLGALGTYVEVLRRRGSDPDVAREMRRAIERIDRTVESLLRYAHPGQHAAARPDDRGADLGEAARAALDFLAAQGLVARHALDVAVEPGLPPVAGDRHLLEQVVVNLVVNASQAAPGGRIAVGVLAQRYAPRHAAAQRRGDAEPRKAAARGPRPPRPRRRDLAPGTPGVLLYVGDSGPGVPEADRERVFDPFFTTKPPGAGTGLGLAIVARTVHEAGGLVWVDRAREGGAAFKVFLPAIGAGEARPAPAETADAPAHR